MKVVSVSRDMLLSKKSFFLAQSLFASLREMTGDHDCAHIILLRTNMNRTILLRALVQFLRWRYYRDTERYYGLLSIPEQIWELERRKQMLVRSMTLWCVACGAGLILARSLFVLPPVTPAQQNVYGILF